MGILKTGKQEYLPLEPMQPVQRWLSPDHPVINEGNIEIILKEEDIDFSYLVDYDTLFSISIKGHTKPAYKEIAYFIDDFYDFYFEYSLYVDKKGNYNLSMTGNKLTYIELLRKKINIRWFET